MPLVSGPTGPMSKAQLQAIAAPVMVARQAAAVSSTISVINTGVLSAANHGMHTYTYPIRNPPTVTSANFRAPIFNDEMVASVCDGVKAIYTDSSVTSTSVAFPNATGLSNYVITVSWV